MELYNLDRTSTNYAAYRHSCAASQSSFLDLRICQPAISIFFHQDNHFQFMIQELWSCRATYLDVIMLWVAAPLCFFFILPNRGYEHNITNLLRPGKAPKLGRRSGR